MCIHVNKRVRSLVVYSLYHSIKLCPTAYKKLQPELRLYYSEAFVRACPKVSALLVVAKKGRLWTGPIKSLVSFLEQLLKIYMIIIIDIYALSFSFFLFNGAVIRYRTK